MNRRDFLALTAFAPAMFAQPPQDPAAPLDRGGPANASPNKLARMSIMTFNYTSRLKLEGAAPSPNRVLEVAEIPQYFADVYGVHNIEYQHSHFASTETSYLKAFRANIEKTKSRMTQINVEFQLSNISAPDPVQRHQAIDLTMRWIDHAVILGCPRIMINQGALTNDTKANATAALKMMNEYAKSKNVKISVETRVVFGPGPAPGAARGPAASGPPQGFTPAPRNAEGLPLSAPGGPPAWELVKEIVEASGTYSNVDIGNIQASNQEALHKVIKGLFPTNSGNMHMKVSPNWDLATAVKYTNNEVGYKGLYSLEVPPQQIRGVYDTILANI